MLTKTLKNLWDIARQLSGDDAYERYLRRHAQKHPEQPPLSRKAFWERNLDLKWNSVRRCC